MRRYRSKLCWKFLVVIYEYPIIISKFELVFYSEQIVRRGTTPFWFHAHTRGLLKLHSIPYRIYLKLGGAHWNFVSFIFFFRQNSSKGFRLGITPLRRPHPARLHVCNYFYICSDLKTRTSKVRFQKNAYTRNLLKLHSKILHYFILFFVQNSSKDFRRGITPLRLRSHPESNRGTPRGPP